MQEMQETQVQSLRQEDPLEEGMATQSIILTWRIVIHRRAWWATVHWVAQSQAQLKRFSSSDRQQSSTALVRGVAPCPHHHALCFCLLGTLLLPASLMLLPGRGALLPPLGTPELQAQPPPGEGSGGKELESHGHL